MFVRAKGLSLLTAAVVLYGPIALPVSAADAPGDAAGNLKPADSSTPTGPASDIDDRRVTAQILQALLADKSLSVLAQRVQVVTNQDAVILRGAVRAGELDKIEALAAQFAGSRQIDNQLTVADQQAVSSP
jgi:hyperosmotically inducible protein